MRISRKLKVGCLILFAGLGAALCALALFLFLMIRPGDYNKTAAVLKNGDRIEAVVHGNVDNAAGWEWSYTLLWHHGQDKWLAYYLDHKGWGFDHYELAKNKDDIMVYCNGDLFGILNTKSKKFVHFGFSFLDLTTNGVKITRFSQYTYMPPEGTLHDHGLDDYETWQSWPDKK
jgi:hypothetical protein